MEERGLWSRHDAAQRTGVPDPRRMRQAMADFVAAVHEAYLAQARLLPPAEQARLPLLARPRG